VRSGETEKGQSMQVVPHDFFYSMLPCGRIQSHSGARRGLLSTVKLNPSKWNACSPKPQYLNTAHSTCLRLISSSAFLHRVKWQLCQHHFKYQYFTTHIWGKQARNYPITREGETGKYHSVSVAMAYISQLSMPVHIADTQTCLVWKHTSWTLDTPVMC